MDSHSHGSGRPAMGGWRARHLPGGWRAIARLTRADRPIGAWLLFLPCAWSVALAGIVDGRAFDVWQLALFALGSFVMRSAGCVWNDLADRHIDGRVARTAARPLPAGAVSVDAAIAIMLALALCGLVVLLQFNTYTVGLGIASLGFVALYPFVKRFWNYPQLVLGLAFSWGALMGWAAFFAALSLAPLLLYAAAVLWTVGYDTIYAHQDREDDAVVGVKSTALRFGTATRAWLAGLYVATVLLVVAAGVLAGADGRVLALAMSGVALHFTWQVATLDIDDADNCLARFRSNRGAGLLVFAALLAAALIRFG